MGLGADADAQPTKPQGTPVASQAELHIVGPGGALLEVDGALALSRTPPPAVGAGDPEAYQVFVSAKSPSTLPTNVSLTSHRAPESGPARQALEVLADVSLVDAPCPAVLGANLTCKRSGPIRLVFDEVDRRHPLLEARSMRAELGGAVSVSADGVASLVHRVGGESGRHRATLRVRLVRMLPKGPAPIGRDDADAVRLAREEIDRANGVWGACGLSFGVPGKVDVAVVDPPPPHLLSIGCDAPALALGGDIRFGIDGREIAVSIAPGTTPRGVARVVERTLDKVGYRATTSDNRSPHASSLGGSDVLVRRSDGALATLSPPKVGAISTDGALDVCIGRVALEDGLQHFTDADAISGTIEERTLVKAFDDGDPSTVEVLVIPSFGGDARIGESFIFLEHGAIRNVVLEDRAGFRAHQASFTLAHELGHVLLDQPGHPDDFGADTPTSLMDADAVDPSAFGPRRLSAAECARAHVQSGARSVSRAIEPWPLAPLPSPKKAKAAR